MSSELTLRQTGVTNVDGHMTLPWSQQLTETPEEYALFRAYYDLGAERSFDSLALFSGKNQDYLRSLAERNRWEGRALAWQNYNLSLVSGLLNDQIDADRIGIERGLVSVMQQLVTELVTRLLLDPEEIRGLTVTELIAKAGKLATILERTAKKSVAKDGDKGNDIQIHLNLAQGQTVTPAPVAEAEFTEVEI